MARADAGEATGPDEVRGGHLGLGIVGLGLLRSWLDPAGAAARTAELRLLLDVLEHDELSPARRPQPMEVLEGYTAWADSYDAEFNPLIEVEQPVVWGWLRELPAGRALDAACGTGRHTAELVRLGFETTGVDATPAMLDLARERVPEASLREGALQDLPFEDGSFDVTVCALALAHAADPSAAISELARVTRAGGTVVISDIHPTAVLTGGRAVFPSAEAGRTPYVINNYQSISSLLRAFRAASLEVIDCEEPVMGTLVEEIAPPPLVDAFRAAIGDVPFAVAWRLHQSG